MNTVSTFFTLALKFFICYLGLDLAHTKLALNELARFHALGVACMRLKPEIFAEAKKLMSEYPFELIQSEIEKFVTQTISMIAQDPRIAKYLDRIESSVKGFDWNTVLNAEPEEPWITITHGDFWVNNMLFKNGTFNMTKKYLFDFMK